MGEREAVVFQDEDGNDVKFHVLDFIEVQGKEYVIVATPDEEQDAYILRIDVQEDGTELYVTIEADEEWEAVADAYEELVEQEDAWVGDEADPKGTVDRAGGNDAQPPA